MTSTLSLGGSCRVSSFRQTLKISGGELCDDAIKIVNTNSPNICSHDKLSVKIFNGFTSTDASATFPSLEPGKSEAFTTLLVLNVTSTYKIIFERLLEIGWRLQCTTDLTTRCHREPLSTYSWE